MKIKKVEFYFKNKDYLFYTNEVNEISLFYEGFFVIIKLRYPNKEMVFPADVIDRIETYYEVDNES